MQKRPVNRKRALEIIGNFPSSRVLVLGDLMVDHFIWGKVSRISPEAPVPVVEVTKENLMMGGSGNVVSNVRAIGGGVAVAGIIGPDDMGRWLVQELKQKKAGERRELFYDSILAQLIKEGKVKKHNDTIKRLVASYRA